MKFKSKAVRRNSSGYRLQDDEPVSGSLGVVDDCSVTPTSSDLGVSHPLLLGSGSVSDYVVIEGVQFGDSMDVDSGLVPNHMRDTDQVFDKSPETKKIVFSKRTMTPLRYGQRHWRKLFRLLCCFIRFEERWFCWFKGWRWR